MVKQITILGYTNAKRITNLLCYIIVCYIMSYYKTEIDNISYCQFV